MIKKIFFTLLSCLSIAIHATALEHPLKTVFTHDSLRVKIGSFFDNVLKQISSEDLLALIDKEACANAKNDQEVYQKIAHEWQLHKPTFQLVSQFSALNHQKSILSKQMLSLLDEKRSFNGALEIGTPGTYLASIQNQISVQGNVYVINETEQLTDKLQAFSLKKPLNGFVPHNKFVSLNDYAPICEQDIPSNSLDLVICFIGLHHIPQEKLTAFIASIHRVLKPGGIFLLRDHDAYDDKTDALVHAAHSTFNAIMLNETVEYDLAEYRNFRPLNYWIELLQQEGFAIDARRLLQDGDPTLNTMIKCTKTARTQNEKFDLFSEKIQQADKEYKRDISQTYLTSPEWTNVDISQEYAHFINHTPFYEFPYMENIKTYWKVFANSFKVAAQKNGRFNTLISQYTMMNLFVGVSMSVEFAAKSMISLPIRMLISGEEASIIKAICHDPEKNLAKLTQVTVLQQCPESGAFLVEIPRYKKFLETIHQLKQHNIVLHEIAGQKEIQVKAYTTNNALLNAMDQQILKYSWKLPTDNHGTYMALSIEVSKLLETLKELEAQQISILYIHDF